MILILMLIYKCLYEHNIYKPDHIIILWRNKFEFKIKEIKN